MVPRRKLQSILKKKIAITVLIVKGRVLALFTNKSCLFTVHSNVKNSQCCCHQLKRAMMIIMMIMVTVKYHIVLRYQLEAPN